MNDNVNFLIFIRDDCDLVVHHWIQFLFKRALTFNREVNLGLMRRLGKG